MYKGGVENSAIISKNKVINYSYHTIQQNKRDDACRHACSTYACSSIGRNSILDGRGVWRGTQPELAALKTDLNCSVTGNNVAGRGKRKQKKVVGAASWPVGGRDTAVSRWKPLRERDWEVAHHEAARLGTEENGVEQKKLVHKSHCC
ncbi:Hypothetical predicted protein [Olea europaea subsp. europaea]|uniref:Uncharacterized protein n=1 Tax=Olea europaea subsp. europaea TaxID=158383 RepID=A0A8S0TQZ5_OLEEU|nr:Hypothetical predicted protein [Olea europaea subsp. europaea]